MSIIQTELTTPEVLESCDGLRQVSDGVHESSSAMSISSTAKSSPIQTPKEKSEFILNFDKCEKHRPKRIVNKDYVEDYNTELAGEIFLAMEKKDYNDDSLDSSPTSMPSGIFPVEKVKHQYDDGEKKNKKQPVKKTKSFRNISPFPLFLRKMVSKNKKRIHDKNLNVNLDLSYIGLDNKNFCTII